MKGHRSQEHASTVHHPPAEQNKLPRVQLAALQRASDASASERRALEAMVVSSNKEAEDASRRAAAEAESLQRALDRSREEASRAEAQLDERQAEMEVSSGTRSGFN